MQIVFKEFRDRLLFFVRCLGGFFSDFLGLENKLENETIFGENLISRSGSGEADRGGIWAL